MKKFFFAGLIIPAAIAALFFTVGTSSGVNVQNRPTKVADIQVVPKSPNIGVIPAITG